MSTGYLIYHPKRTVTHVGRIIVHHDKFGGNEDPYIWNKQFLHTYCHITQLKNEEGQTNFWISGDTWPNFNALYCDCVFVVQKKYYWDDANTMKRNNPLVENDQTYEHHYKWGDADHGHHRLTRRRRYTLKADPKLSFQPQDGKGNLIDVLPFFLQQGLTIGKLRRGLKATRGSKPFEIGGLLGDKLYNYLVRVAPVKLTGKQLENRHPIWNKGLTSSAASCC